jgi:hypothetical protein
MSGLSGHGSASDIMHGAKRERCRSVLTQPSFPRYQVCLFCYERIKLELNGLCPSCRTPYGSPQEASPRQASTPSFGGPSSNSSSMAAASSRPQSTSTQPPPLSNQTGLLQSGRSSEAPENPGLELQETPLEQASAGATAGPGASASKQGPPDPVRTPSPARDPSDLATAPARSDQNAESSSTSNADHRTQKHGGAKPSPVVWGQSTSSSNHAAAASSNPPKWAQANQGLSDVHRVRQNSSEAAVQSSVGFSWGPPPVMTSSAVAKQGPASSSQPAVDTAKSVKEVTHVNSGGNVWGSGTVTAAAVLKGGLGPQPEAPPQPVLTPSSFPSLASGVPKPQNPGRKGKRARTPAAVRNGGLVASASGSAGSTPQNSRPGTPMQDNGTLDSFLEKGKVSKGGAEGSVDRKEDGAAALSLLETKHGRSLSEDVLQGFEGLRSEGQAAGLRPTSSGGVRASTSRLFPGGGYGLNRTFSSRASSIGSEDSGSSLGGGSPARGGTFGKSVYGAALGGSVGQGGNGWTVGSASSRQYSEGWTPEALAKVRSESYPLSPVFPRYFLLGRCGFYSGVIALSESSSPSCQRVCGFDLCSFA